ncbi:MULTISPECIES: alpha/beta hydrolase [Actinomycetes]|uniref:Alpha/beta hydrolase n=2 Tax=Actinomycetes TaxID=1760 RepID=A0ABP6LQY0_9MICC
MEDAPAGDWVPDILPGCVRRTLPLGEDEEGPLSATLVRYDGTPKHDTAHDTAHDGGPLAPVLHLHGWSDYFYNTPLARSFAAAGRPFYALDLRRYGRSLRSWQTPGYIDDLTEYDADLESALEVIRSEHPQAPAPLIHGHSTGGLVAALWAHRHPGRASGLILNSPWLELPGDAAARAAVEGLLAPLSHLNPRRPLRLPRVDNYWQSLSDQAHGEWSLHPLWRPRRSFPMPAGWLRAVLAGHRQVYDGLDVQEPVLVLLSTQTVYSRQWKDQLRESDIVLDVELLARRAVRLGGRVTVVRLARAMHDVFASPEPVRLQAFDEVRRWLRAYAPEAESADPADPAEAAEGATRSTAAP